jgi:hypothetical protein
MKKKQHKSKFKWTKKGGVGTKQVDSIIDCTTDSRTHSIIDSIIDSVQCLPRAVLPRT